MKYTLTRANPDADQYPSQDRQIVTDPLEEEVNKSVMMTKTPRMLIHSLMLPAKARFITLKKAKNAAIFTTEAMNAVINDGAPW